MNAISTVPRPPDLRLPWPPDRRGRDHPRRRRRRAGIGSLRRLHRHPRGPRTARWRRSGLRRPRCHCPPCRMSTARSPRRCAATTCTTSAAPTRCCATWTAPRPCRGWAPTPCWAPRWRSAAPPPLAAGQPLYRRIAQLAGVDEPVLPMPMVNILSGGLHAGRGMDVQDFLAVPVGATSALEAIQLTSRVARRRGPVCAERGLPTLLADEGGLSPGCRPARKPSSCSPRSIERAGLRPGDDIAIAIDVAAASLYDRADRRLPPAPRGTAPRAPRDDRHGSVWVDAFPIVSIEDPLDEEDWDGWQALTDAARRAGCGSSATTCSPPTAQRLAPGHRPAAAANGVLVKVNQNGTLTGTLDVVAQAARPPGYAPVVSARSGETEDDFLADLAVGTAAGQIKIGSVRNSERLAKYNQLVRIAEDPTLGSASCPALALPAGPSPVTGADPRAGVQDFLRRHGLLRRRCGPRQLDPAAPAGCPRTCGRSTCPAADRVRQGRARPAQGRRRNGAPRRPGNRVEYHWLRFAGARRPRTGARRSWPTTSGPGLFAMAVPAAAGSSGVEVPAAGRAGATPQDAAAVGDLVGRLHAASAADAASPGPLRHRRQLRRACASSPFLRITAPPTPTSPTGSSTSRAGPLPRTCGRPRRREPQEHPARPAGPGPARRRMRLVRRSRLRRRVLRQPPPA